jgi:PP-loop superfamily ATP-utilizing enzyme
MDSSAEEFRPTKKGCNFCDRAEQSLAEIKSLTLPEIKGGKYDCLIGLSGGVDSSYLLHKAVEMGLRPLCFSVDNGWQDPKADENIMRMVETLRVPFYRYAIDLDKFEELQAAFVHAGQKNIEIPTDHVLLATTFEMARKYKIRWVLSGGNVATESIMPESWGYQPRDLRHIKDVFRRSTGQKLKGLPLYSLWQYNVDKWWHKIETFYLLDYVGYNRADAIKILEKTYGWKDYGEKHGENIFTKWFQNFYLLEKFGIDKRKAHLSSLIVSGQMTRTQALKELRKKPKYPKLGVEKLVLGCAKRNYREFKTNEVLFGLISSTIRFLR